MLPVISPAVGDPALDDGADEEVAVEDDAQLAFEAADRVGQVVAGQLAESVGAAWC